MHSLVWPSLNTSSSSSSSPVCPPLHHRPSFPPSATLWHCAAAAVACKNRPLSTKGRVILVNVVQRSLIYRSPDRQTRVSCHRPRRQGAVAPAALRSHHAPTQVHQMPEVVFCASPSAASAATPRLRCHGMFSVCHHTHSSRVTGPRVSQKVR